MEHQITQGKPQSTASKKPQADFRDDLKTALATETNFDGNYYYKAGQTPAINPNLRITGIGPIELPLTASTAGKIFVHSATPQFSRTDKTVLDVKFWRIGAKDVHFDNPAWRTFMDDVARKASFALGVNPYAYTPRCELSGLCLQIPGLHTAPHKEPEKPDGTFATISVVLQSPFTGGEVHLSRGGLSTVIKTSKQSQLSTSVVAWRTEVTHETKPIGKGARLTLSYNLILSKMTIPPSLPTSHPASEKLRTIFTTWKEQGDPGPQKVICLLDPEDRWLDSRAKPTNLRRSESHRIGLANLVAKECGFNMGFADIRLHVYGLAQDADDEFREEWDTDLEFCDDRTIDDFIIGEVQGEDMSITKLVDLDGKLIAKTVDYDEAFNETIPLVNFVVQVEMGHVHDERLNEAEPGEHTRTLERWYRRSALVIWPDSRQTEIAEGVRTQATAPQSPSHAKSRAQIPGDDSGEDGTPPAKRRRV